MGRHERGRSGAGELTDELIGGAVGLIPLFGSLAAPLGERFSRSVRDEHQRNTSRALRAAERRSGMSREELAERITECPELVPLATRLMYAAGMTGQDRTLSAVGACFGEAAAGIRPIDEADLLLASLSDLQDIHFVFLRTCSLDPPVAKSENGKDMAARWYPETFRLRLGVSRGVAVMGVAGLTRAGLIYGRAAIEGTSYRLTELGEAALVMLDAVDDEQSELPNR